MKSAEYLEGFHDCQNEYERVLDASIRKHRGATTLLDCFNVLNDIIYFVQSQKLLIHSERNLSSTEVM
jgi:hypothetical protein